MPRLFTGLEIPRDIADALAMQRGGLPGARWIDPENYHLTLRFIGEVDRHQAGDIHAALGAIHQPPFEIALNGIGAFDKRGWPDAVWAGVTPHEPLKALHNKVDAALGRVGVAPDQRAFLPHITLARLKRSSGPVGSLLEEAGGLSSPPFAVDHFALFESTLTPDGAVYSVLERYRLG